jgi:hypothetical protein
MISTNKPSIDLLVYTVALEEYYEIKCSLTMNVIKLKVLETQFGKTVSTPC